jgi:Ca2+-binding RTX toxin-like protein
MDTTGGTGSITLGGGNALLSGGNGALNIDVLHGGGVDTVNLYSGSANISVDGSSSLLLGAPTANMVLTFLGGGGNATVFGNTGSTTLLGASGSSVVFNGYTGTTVYKAGAGNETLDASNSNANSAISVVGSSFSDSNFVARGGAGADTISSGAGAETMVGGAGANVFVFSSIVGGPASQTTVEDFGGSDIVQLKGYGANPVTNASQQGQNVTLTLADNTQITFLNTTVSAVNGAIHTS